VVIIPLKKKQMERHRALHRPAHLRSGALVRKFKPARVDRFPWFENAQAIADRVGRFLGRDHQLAVPDDLTVPGVALAILRKDELALRLGGQLR
jgi:hypothetical protein